MPHVHLYSPSPALSSLLHSCDFWIAASTVAEAGGVPAEDDAHARPACGGGGDAAAGSEEAAAAAAAAAAADAFAKGVGLFCVSIGFRSFFAGGLAAAAAAAESGMGTSCDVARVKSTSTASACTVLHSLCMLCSLSHDSHLNLWKHCLHSHGRSSVALPAATTARLAAAFAAVVVHSVTMSVGDATVAARVRAGVKTDAHAVCFTGSSVEDDEEGQEEEEKEGEEEEEKGKGVCVGGDDGGLVVADKPSWVVL